MQYVCGGCSAHPESHDVEVKATPPLYGGVSANATVKPQLD